MKHRNCDHITCFNCLLKCCLPHFCCVKVLKTSSSFSVNNVTQYLAVASPQATKHLSSLARSICIQLFVSFAMHLSMMLLCLSLSDL